MNNKCPSWLFFISVLAHFPIHLVHIFDHQWALKSSIETIGNRPLYYILLSLLMFDIYMQQYLP